MDVFVAYSSKDEARVRTIVEWLRHNGIEVWVAYELPAGVDWDTQIDEVLSEIPCVLTVWSPDSVASAEVKGEARAAMARDALVTVSLDKALPPRSFTHLHAVDLTDLGVTEDSSRTRQVLQGIRAKLSAADTVVDIEAVRTASSPPAVGRRGIWLGGGIALLAVAGLVVLNSGSLAGPSCDDEGAMTLAGQTFNKDTVIKEPLVCIAANAQVRVTNGARLDIEAETLVIEGAARIDGRGRPGSRGRSGSDGPVHHHKPPKVAGIAVCGTAPARSDYSGSNGGRGGNGGPGARISIRFNSLQGDVAQLKHDVTGGAGGAGGAGGRAGLATCKVIKPYRVKGSKGRTGPRGASGKSGSFELVQVSA